MSQPTEQRPPQVTLASGIVMFASVMVLLTAWERVASLGSLETQQSIRDLLAEPPFSSLGLDVEGATGLLRISGMVAAAAACGTAILGWYVRKPDRSARLGLSLLAVPVFVTGLTAGGLAGSFVAAGAAMLWVNPAREWFATGRWTPPAPARDVEKPGRSGKADRGAAGATQDYRGSWGAGPQAPQDQPGAGAAQPPGPPPADRPFGQHQPVPHNAYGQPVPPGAYAEAPTQDPSRPPQPWAQDRLPQVPPPWQQHRPLDTRPGAMVAAFVITVVTAGGLLALSLLWFAIAGFSPDFLMSVLEEQQPQMMEDGLTRGEVRTTVFALASGAFVWGSAALVLAGFAMARRDWARRGLMVSAAFSAGACFALMLTAPFVLVPAVAAVATVVCLRRVEVRRWFSPDPR
ncbi:hypothetical protein HN031_05080 [Nocardioides sp. zg-1308]|uniref:hypothetical protein n=1 Tax=Nocardioides sp. zg-1308 TaxID=2736253 RepID=UPI001555D2A4|nr:hypothetical protein [Nocardioides sp. zg-1308]NPD04054.1 hypothetical protein [Nocardioides sp. zg-1308]